MIVLRVSRAERDPLPDLLVGVDVGTSAVKVLAVTPAGRTVSEASRTYPLDVPQAGWAQQDAELLYDATMSALREVARTLPERSAVVLGLSCAMHALLPVDREGRPLGPLLTWLDRRADGVAERWRADGTAAQLYAATGAPVHAMLPSCKLRAMQEHEGAVFAAADRFISLKELLVFRWTGEWLIDWGTASGTGLFDPRMRTWSAEALAAAGIEAARLSTPASPLASREANAALATHLGLASRPQVVLGSSDGALANLGVGAVGEGDLALTLGTSGALRAVSREPLFDSLGRTFCYAYDDVRYIVGGPTNSGGAVLRALQALFLNDVAPEDRFERALTLAESSLPGARGLTVLPFLAGERAPYWRTDLRGSIAGLDLGHTPADLARASFEGLVFALRSVLETLPERIVSPSELRLSGGLCRFAFVRQLIADVFGREAFLANQEEASAYGAAMMAGIAIGVLSGGEAAAATLRPLHVHHPVPEGVARYEASYARYRRVADAMLAFYAREDREALH